LPEPKNKPHDEDDAPSDEQKKVAAEYAKKQAQKKRELELRRRVFKLIHTKWKGPLKREDLQLIAQELVEQIGNGELLEDLWGEPGLDLRKATERDLGLYCLQLILENCLYATHYSAEPMMTIAKRLKIDPAKIKKDIAAEERAKVKAEALERKS
jgi:hypothetical protein